VLVLSRRMQEGIVIDGVLVKVLGIRGSRVVLGVEAPRGVRVERDELTVAKDEHLADGRLGP
jgi:carbon storage regulator CsrA